MADQSAGQPPTGHSPQKQHHPTLNQQQSVRFAEDQSSSQSKTTTTKKPRPAPLELPTTAQEIELTKQDSVKRSPFITPQNSIQPVDLSKRMEEIMNASLIGLGNKPIYETEKFEREANLGEPLNNNDEIGSWNDFTIPPAVHEAGDFNNPNSFPKTPGNTQNFPKTVGEPSPDNNTRSTDLNHEAESFRPRLNTQKSVYTEIAMDLHEQMKDILQFGSDNENSNNSDSNSVNEKININNQFQNNHHHHQYNNNHHHNNILGSMFPTPKTDLVEVEQLKISQLPKSPRGSNSGIPTEQEPVSAVGIIADNEVEKLVKAEGRGEKSWMTPDILQGIEERDRLFSEMKAAPYDKAIEAAYKKKRNQVVTLTRRAKRELKNKIRPGVEKNIKEQIKKQVQDKGAAAVSREVELTAQTILSNANSGRNTPNVRHQSGGHGNPTHLTERLHPGNINVPPGGGYHIRSHSNPQMAHLHPMSQTQRLSNPGSGHSSPSRFNANVHRQPIGPPNTSSYQGGQAFSRGGGGPQDNQHHHNNQQQQRFQQPKHNNNSNKNQQQVQVPTVQLAPPQTGGTGVTKTGSWSAMLKK